MNEPGHNMEPQNTCGTVWDGTKWDKLPIPSRPRRFSKERTGSRPDLPKYEPSFSRHVSFNRTRSRSAVSSRGSPVPYFQTRPCPVSSHQLFKNGTDSRPVQNTAESGVNTARENFSMLNCPILSKAKKSVCDMKGTPIDGFISPRLIFQRSPPSVSLVS